MADRWAPSHFFARVCVRAIVKYSREERSKCSCFFGGVFFFVWESMCHKIQKSEYFDEFSPKICHFQLRKLSLHFNVFGNIASFGKLDDRTGPLGKQIQILRFVLKWCMKAFLIRESGPRIFMLTASVLPLLTRKKKLQNVCYAELSMLAWKLWSVRFCLTVCVCVCASVSICPPISGKLTQVATAAIGNGRPGLGSERCKTAGTHTRFLVS